MGNASPQSLMFVGMAVAGMSFKLKADYVYFYYLGIVVGLFLFITGIVKHYNQRR